MQISKISLKNKKDFDFLRQILAPYTKRVYLVGGSVRDLLLGKKLGDFDIEIYDLKLEVFDNLMQNLGANGVGKSFFVYKYKNFDLSLARYENKISVGHKGFKTFICNDEKQAALRRDFSINSMMVNIFNDEFLDFYGGFEDLKDKILRHINSDRFKEDSLRVLRAIHFVSRFDLRLDPSTLSLMKSMDINELSLDRINSELYKFFASKNLLLGFLLLQELNLEEKIFYFNSTTHKNYSLFKSLLQSSRKFVFDDGIFLYIYLNLFNINQKDFFKKTKIKKYFLKKSSQFFYKDDISYESLCELALSMKLKQWLGLWDKKRINMAKELSCYDKKLDFKINSYELMKEGFYGKDLAYKIKEIQKEKIRQKCANLTKTMI